MIYLMASIVCVWIIGVILIEDCKEYGKERLAVSLWDRLKAFFLCFVLPVIAAAVIISLLVLMMILLRGRVKNDSKKNDGTAGRPADCRTASCRRGTGSGGSAGS